MDECIKIAAEQEEIARQFGFSHYKREKEKNLIEEYLKNAFIN